VQVKDDKQIGERPATAGGETKLFIQANKSELRNLGAMRYEAFIGLPRYLGMNQEWSGAHVHYAAVGDSKGGATDAESTCSARARKRGRERR